MFERNQNHFGRAVAFRLNFERKMHAIKNRIFLHDLERQKNYLVFGGKKMIKMFKIEFAGFFAKTLSLVVHVNMFLNQCLNEIRTILERPWHLD